MTGSQARAGRDVHNSVPHAEETTPSNMRSSRPHIRSTIVSVCEHSAEPLAPKGQRAAPRGRRNNSVSTSRHSAVAIVPNMDVHAAEQSTLVNGEALGAPGTPISVLTDIPGSPITVRSNSEADTSDVALDAGKVFRAPGTPISVVSDIPGSPITVRSDSDPDTSNVTSDAGQNLSWDQFNEVANSQVATGLIRYPEDFPSDIDYYNTVSGYPIKEVDRRMIDLMDAFTDHTITIDSRGFYQYPRFELSPPSSSERWFVVTWGWTIGVYDDR